MALSRQLEVDVAFALGGVSFVEGVFALDPRGAAARNPDALLFAVTLRPYCVENLVAAHYALLAVVPYEVTGRALYVDPDAGLSSPVRRARRLSLTSLERMQAAERAAGRTVRVELGRRRREEEEARSAAALRRLLGDRPPAAVAAPFDSGVFEIVADPFPSLVRQPARLLVLDEDPRTSACLRSLGDEVVVEQPESSDWSAVDRLLRGDYDLVLCALRFGSWSGAQLYRMVAQNNPSVAARVVFVSDVAPQAPPESARGRVLTKPLDPEELRSLLYGRRAGPR